MKYKSTLEKIHEEVLKYADMGQTASCIPELTKFKKDNWWLSFDGNTVNQIKAIDELYAIKRRLAVRWYIGMLHGKYPEVRAHIAYLLGKTEYTVAINDLQVALQVKET